MGVKYDFSQLDKNFKWGCLVNTVLRRMSEPRREGITGWRSSFVIYTLHQISLERSNLGECDRQSMHLAWQRDKKCIQISVGIAEVRKSIGILSCRYEDNAALRAGRSGFEGLIPDGGCEFFSSPPRPERLRGPPSLLSSGYQGLFPWG
jgi:hypothetical protein